MPRDQDLFLEALDLPSGSERQRFLDEACADDADLRREVEMLLASYGTAVGHSFLEQPALLVADPGDEERPAPGTRVGPYELLRELGEGGFGVVFEAEQHEPLRRRVALKMIKPGMDTRAIVARFEAERQALAMLDHPNIAAVLDAGSGADGRPYFVMELVAGEPITSYANRCGLGTLERIRLMIQVCEAIQHAHRRGLIHRDIKPSNILISEATGAPQPKVIDFGVAKAIGSQQLSANADATVAGQLVGTPQYMSPEQARASERSVDTRTDVHGLGLVLYELLAGSPPIDVVALLRGGGGDVERAICEQIPERPSVRVRVRNGTEGITDVSGFGHLPPTRRSELDWIVLRALEKEPDRRYQSASELGADLQRFLDDQPVLARPPSRIYQLRKMVRRNRLAVSAAVAVILAVLGGSGLALLMAFRAEEAWRQEQAAEEQTRHSYSMSDFRVANLLIADDKVSTGVAYLCRALRSDPDNELAAARLLATLAGSDFARPVFTPVPLAGRPTQVTFSPDGRWITTVGNRGRVREWDAQTGQPRAVPEMQHSQKEFVVSAVDPAHRRIALGSVHGVLEVFDLETGARLAGPMLHGAGETIRGVAISPDGGRVYAAGHDGVVSAWDVATGTSAWTHRHEPSVPASEEDPIPGRATCIDVAPGGALLVVGFGDGQAEVLQAASGELRAVAACHPDVIFRIRFLAQDDRFVTGSWGGEAHVWDAATGAPVGAVMHHDSSIYEIAVSPCGTRVATASYDHTARIWDSATGKALGPPLRHAAEVFGVAFSPDGAVLATAGSGDDLARLWDGHTGEPIGVPMAHDRPPCVLAFSPDGRRLATGTRNHDLHLWDLRPRAQRPLELPQDEFVAWIGFTDAGATCTTLTHSGAARRWDTRTGLMAGREDLPWSPGAPELGPGRDDTATVAVASLPSGDPRRDAILDLLRRGALQGTTCHAVSPDSSVLIAGKRDGTAVIWDLRRPAAAVEPSRVEVGQAAISCVATDPTGSLAAFGLADGSLRLLELATNTLRPAQRLHERAVSCVVFSADGAALATGSHDNTACIWSAASGEPRTARLAHDDIADRWGILCWFTPDGSRLLTGGSQDGTLRIWDAASGEPTSGSPLDLDATVFAAAGSRSGQVILTGTRTHLGQSRLDIRSAVAGDLLAPSLRGGSSMTQVICAPDGERAAVADWNGVVSLVDLPPRVSRVDEWFLAMAEAIASCRLDARGKPERVPLEDAGAALAAARAACRDDASPLARWSRWLVADPDSRTISPASTVSAAQLRDRLVARGTVEDLRAALRLDPCDRAIMGALPAALRASSDSPVAEQEARFYERASRGY